MAISSIYCDRPYGALEGADGLVIVTEWQEFRHPDFEVMRRLLREPVIFDGRNIYEPKAMQAMASNIMGLGADWLRKNVKLQTVYCPMMVCKQSGPTDTNAAGSSTRAQMRST